MDAIKALTFIYITLSIIDAIITSSLLKILMDHHELNTIEANPIVVKLIENFGIGGMLCYKFVMVVTAIWIIFYVDKYDHTRHSLFRRFVKPHYLMWYAIFATMIAISCGIIYYFLYSLPVGQIL